jgi:hypothetical protein
VPSHQQRRRIRESSRGSSNRPCRNPGPVESFSTGLRRPRHRQHHLPHRRTPARLRACSALLPVPQKFRLCRPSHHRPCFQVAQPPLFPVQGLACHLLPRRRRLRPAEVNTPRCSAHLLRRLNPHQLLPRLLRPRRCKRDRVNTRGCFPVPRRRVLAPRPRCNPRCSECRLRPPLR